MATPPPPTADSLNSGLRVHFDAATAAFQVTWWGKDAFYYFIEHSDDLKAWSFVPSVEAGLDAPLSMAFQPNIARWFWRLRFSDDPESALLSTDYNGIGMSAWDQIQLGFNPFDWVDTEENGFHDAWEIFWFGALDVVDPDVDSDGDGQTNLQEFLAGTNPEAKDNPNVGLLGFHSMNAKQSEFSAI